MKIDNSIKTGTGFSDIELILDDVMDKFKKHDEEKEQIQKRNNEILNKAKEELELAKKIQKTLGTSLEIQYKEHVLKNDELRVFEGTIYRWKDTFWSANNESEEICNASYFIESIDSSRVTEKKAIALVNFIKHFLKNIEEDNKIIVPLKNAYLIYDKEKHAFIVTKPEKKYGVRHQINLSVPETKAIVLHNDMAGYEPEFGSVYKFDEIEENGYLDRFLKNSLKDEGKRQTTQELIGYSLQRNLELNKFAAFYGPGRNGKTATQQLTSMLHRNPVTIELNNKDSFALETIIGSTLLLSPETPADGINELWLKQLSGGDRLRVNIKFEKAKSIINKSMLFLNFNELPRFKDASNAIKRRAVFVEFDVLNDKDVVANIADKIFVNDGKAFLDWALQGLLEVIKNEKIFECEKSIELKNEVFDEQDSIAQFFATKEFEEDLGGRGITKTVLYDEYVDFCGKYFYVFGYQKFCSRAKTKFKVSKKTTPSGREEVYLIKRKYK